MHPETFEVHAGKLLHDVGYDTRVVACLPSEPAICGADTEDGILRVEIVALPGRNLPRSVTVLLDP
jgi:hypothetical protein